MKSACSYHEGTTARACEPGSSVSVFRFFNRTMIVTGLLAILVWGQLSAFGRTWTDNTGKFKVEAEFVGLDGEQVHLKKTTGAVDPPITKVPWRRLSKPDQEFVRRQVSQSIAREAGTVSRFSPASDFPWVVVFEETHTSRAGQLEIALMMLRLYRDYQMRSIGLEGYVKEESAHAKWFHEIPGTDSQRRLVATQLLADGEISCAEYMSLVLPDVKLHPIEVAAEYSVELKDEASAAGMVYLFRIAAHQVGSNGMTPAQAKKLQELQRDPKKIGDLIEFVIGLDPWTAEKWRILQQQGQKAIQIEELLAILDQITEKAAELNAEVEPEDREAMKDLKQFFVARGQASATMVNEAIAVARQSEKKPITMVIGAAHTDRVCELFDRARQSYIVIKPTSMGRDDKSQISMAAFNRKHERLSVDEANQLGSLFDGRKKPPPSLSSDWLQIKAELAVISTKLANAIRLAGRPRTPFDPPFGLEPRSLNRPMIRVAPDSMELDDDEIVFQAVIYPDDPGKRDTIWIRTAYVGPIAPIRDDARDITDVASLEALLMSTLETARTGKSSIEIVNEQLAQGERQEEVSPPSESDAPPIQVASNVLIRAAKEKGKVTQALVSG